MIELRDISQMAAVPMEFIAAMPPGSRDILIDLIIARDRWVVQDRCD